MPVVIAAAWILRKTMAEDADPFRAAGSLSGQSGGARARARGACRTPVIAANHASFLDGLLLGAFLPGDRSSRSTRSSRRSGGRSRSSCSSTRCRSIRPTRCRSARMIRAVEGGATCIIFPEGRITTTGSADEGLRRPGRHCRARQGAALSRCASKASSSRRSPASPAVRQRWFPRIRVRVMPPRMLTAPEGVTGRARRVALRRELGDVMVQWCSPPPDSIRRCSTRCSKRAACTAAATS